MLGLSFWLAMGGMRAEITERAMESDAPAESWRALGPHREPAESVRAWNATTVSDGPDVAEPALSARHLCRRAGPVTRSSHDLQGRHHRDACSVYVHFAQYLRRFVGVSRCARAFHPVAVAWCNSYPSREDGFAKREVVTVTDRSGGPHHMTIITPIFPVEGAILILLARHLGMGRSSSGPAEWPVKDVSDLGPRSGAAGVFLCTRRS